MRAAESLQEACSIGKDNKGRVVIVISAQKQTLLALIAQSSLQKVTTHQ
jgi:hypothetical protein